ncbi:MAG: hypothetical protein ACK5N8_04240 [Alphaproteobacteria bacterium]
MEEAKKEDMSTEQILSSIRTILTDENAEETSIDDSDEILDLSSEKVVDTDVPETIEENIEEDVDIYDLTSAMVIKEEKEETPLSDEIFEDELYELSEAQEVEDVLDLSAEEIVEVEEILSPIEKAENSVENIVSFEKEEIIDVPEDNKKTGEEKPQLEDVANNIISAFSNLFEGYSSSKKTKVERPKMETEYDENELKAQVQKTVENWVVKNIDSDLKIKEIVEEEIALQTRVWLDENLPDLIQSSINQELERVMVKVDKAQ